MKKSIGEVAVLGGGVIGLSAAAAMALQGHQVSVIDAGPLALNKDKPDTRVYAINRASEALLQNLGIWDFLDQSRLSPYQHMHVWDASTGSSIDFDSRMIAFNKLGLIIEESVLKNALLQRLQTLENISFFPNQEIVEVKDGDQHFEIASAGNKWQGQLLIIADGANSPARQQLKIPMTSWPYKQHALIATVSTEKSHGFTAYQVFNPEGPLAFLPLKNEHECSIVWSTSPGQALKLMNYSELEFNSELEKAFDHKLGAVSVISKRYQFPLIMRHANQYSGNHWLLMGDAAHTIHPLAGLGLNIGLADVAAWSDICQNSALHFSKKVLASYQRQRKSAVWQNIALMEGFKTLFSSSLLPVKLLRGLGLSACDHLTPVKRLFIAHAAG